MVDGRQERSLWKTSHIAHALTFLMLLATGALLFSPALRSRLTGGYSLHVGLVHCWVGVAFAIATLPFARRAIRSHRPSSRDEERVSVSPSPIRRWHDAHLLFTVVAGAAFTVTGLLLWRQDLFSLVLIDWSATIHQWLTYAACVVLTAHLSVAVIVPLLRSALEQARATVPARERAAAAKGAPSCS